jgi:hypothetical protein
MFSVNLTTETPNSPRTTCATPMTLSPATTPIQSPGLNPTKRLGIAASGLFLSCFRTRVFSLTHGRINHKADYSLFHRFRPGLNLINLLGAYLGANSINLTELGA